MEDLLEEIVARLRRVRSARNTASRAPAEAGATPASGRHRDPGGERLFRLDLDDADYTTIGGLLFGTLGRLPNVGIGCAVRGGLGGGVFSEIVEMDGRRVGKARVWRPPKLERAACWTSAVPADRELQCRTASARFGFSPSGRCRTPVP